MRKQLKRGRKKNKGNTKNWRKEEKNIQINKQNKIRKNFTGEGRSRRLNKHK
jgi:hypothetical protein